MYPGPGPSPYTMARPGPTNYPYHNIDIECGQNFVIGRRDKMAECWAALEKNIEFVGVTAVEDRLQDGVPATIQLLRRAGIRVWMLTGDKVETGMDIAQSCFLFDKEMEVHRITGGNAMKKLWDAKEAIYAKEAMTNSSNPHFGGAEAPPTVTSPTSRGVRPAQTGEQAAAAASRGESTPSTATRGDSHAKRRPSLTVESAKPQQHLNTQVGLVLDGVAVAEILNDTNGPNILYEVGVRCHACVCCRLSPMQKRQLVECVRTAAPRTITAAIGDGANDVEEKLKNQTILMFFCSKTSKSYQFQPFFQNLFVNFVLGSDDPCRARRYRPPRS